MRTHPKKHAHAFSAASTNPAVTLSDANILEGRKELLEPIASYIASYITKNPGDPSPGPPYLDVHPFQTGRLPPRLEAKKHLLPTILADDTMRGELLDIVNELLREKNVRFRAADFGFCEPPGLIDVIATGVSMLLGVPIYVPVRRSPQTFAVYVQSMKASRHPTSRRPT
jgi:hypothetical protein